MEVRLLQLHVVVVAPQQRHVEVPHAVIVAGVHQISARELAHFLGQIAEHGGERGVDLDDSAAQIRKPGADPGLGEHRAKPGFAGSQLLLDAASRDDLGGSDAFLLGEQPGAEGPDVAVGESPEHVGETIGRYDTRRAEMRAEHANTATQHLVSDEMRSGELGPELSDPRGRFRHRGDRLEFTCQPGQQRTRFLGTHRHHMVTDPTRECSRPAAGQGVRTVRIWPGPGIPTHGS